jgi:hypothetical protein
VVLPTDDKFTTFGSNVDCQPDGLQLKLSPNIKNLINNINIIDLFF